MKSFDNNSVIIAFIWIKKPDNLDANRFWNDIIILKEDNTLNNTREKLVHEGYVKVI